MTTPTFAPARNPVASASTVDMTPRILKADFGDGYSQRTEDGLNAQQDDATWVWSYCSADEFENLRAFFASMKGALSFFWTPPDEAVPKKFICSQWTKSFDSAVTRTMTAKFTQVFDPGD